MKIEIKLDAKKEPFFIERRRITSGRIVRSGFDDFGVVFSGIGKPNEVDQDPPAEMTASENDFKPEHLLGAILGWRSAAESEDHKFFEILGGYFYHQGGAKDGQTSQVFGIVKENAFGVRENGKTTVNDNWKLAEPSTRGLDENEGRGSGWTFIVRWKDGGDFPHSSTQLKICFENPEIEMAVASLGDCVPDADGKQLRRKVTLKAKTKAVIPKNWTWHFGDGQEQTGDGVPPESLDHLYAKAPAQKPRLVVSSNHPMGQESSMEVDLSAFEACPECPVIDSATAQMGDCKDDNGVMKREITFSATTSAGAPAKWHWDFGDGSSDSGDGAPPASVSHLYEKAPANTPKLTLHGNAPCQSVSAEAAIADFKACAQCPKITSFTAEIGDCVRDAQKNTLRKQVTFGVAVEGGEVVKWRCDFGDGESESGTGTPPATMTHLYASAPGSSPALTLEGPAPCAAASAKVDLSGFEPCPPCPEVKHVSVRTVAEDDKTTTCEFKIAIEGAAPSQYEWDFGDGSKAEKTTEPVTTHVYKRGERDVRIVASVALVGPHSCRAKGQKQVDIPKVPPPDDKPEKPVKPCLWLQLLTAFWAALALGCLTLRVAAGAFYPEVDAGNATIAFFIFAVLAVISVVWWQSFVKKKLCAPIRPCQWKAVAWTALLAAALVALYIVKCCPIGWWGAIILLFAVAGYILFNWLKTCDAATTRAMLLHLLAAFVAAFLVSVFIARTIFEACL